MNSPELGPYPLLLKARIVPIDPFGDKTDLAVDQQYGDHSQKDRKD